MTQSAENVFVGRQPIYDRKLELFGYELLYRDSDENAAHINNANNATSQLLINTFMDIGLENIVGSSPAFINLPKTFFTDEVNLPITKEQVVLEIPDNALADEKTLDKVQQLAAEGYTISLEHSHFHTNLEPLLPIVRFVKIDVSALEKQQLAEQIRRLRPHPNKLIALKVETQEQFQLCRDLDVDYYQGFYFSQPHIVKDLPIPGNRLVLLKLLSTLQQPEADFKEIEKLIIQDASLSYRLLRYINCATFALRQEIESIHQAVVILGLNNIRNWTSLLMMSRANRDKPAELMVISLVRGRMCELLARQSGQKDHEKFFTVGLFSILDAMLDRPMEMILDHMPLIAPLKLALLDNEGELGRVLKLTLDYEKGNWEAIPESESGLQLRDIYIEAIKWADANIKALLTTS